MNRSAFLSCCTLLLAPLAAFHAEDAPKAAAGLTPPDAVEQAVGNYGSHTLTGNTVVFHCSSGATVRIELCQTDVARIRMAVPGANFVANEPYAVVKYDWPAVGATLTDVGDYIKIATTEMVIRANKVPFHLGFYERDNATLITGQTATNAMGWKGTAKSMALQRDVAGKTEHFYGCGMHWKHFDLRGLNLKMFQIDPNLNHGSLDGSAITVVPYYWSTAGYGMLLHNSFISQFDFGRTNPALVAWDLAGGELDFYFLKGPTFKKIIQHYCDLTGYLELPPKKALGLTYRAQGNNGYLLPKPVYLGAADLDALTTAFRAHGVPCDIIATEPGWAVGYGNLVWETNRFPDPKGWCAGMTDKGFMVNLWMQDRIEDRELGALLSRYTGAGGLLDPTMSQGMDAYFGWLKTHLFDLGVTGGFKEDTHGVDPSWIKTDATRTLKSGLSLKEYHNPYSYLWAKGLFDRYKAAYNQRFLLFCTALWTGAQRYALVAYSDQGVQIPWIANSGWTGMAYTPELQNWSGAKSYRDLQAIAFTPYMVQNEWIYGKQPWGSDPDAFNVFLRYAKLHYRLIPYLYSQMWEQHLTGIGPIRPLPLEFQADERTYSVSNQYCYGPNLMVAFDRSSIYLPQGNWTYYWDGRTFEGGRTLTNFEAPADELPVFVRAGAIIPMMPDMNYVGEKPLDPLIVDVYPEGTSTFTLYEDDGISCDYEKGEYCTTEYRALKRPDGVTLDIGARKAPGAYVPARRHYLFKVHTRSDPGNVYLDGTALEKQTSGRAVSDFLAGWHYADGVAQISFSDTGKRMRLGLGTWVTSSGAPAPREGVKPKEARNIPKEIRAYDIDFNWGPGGVNGFAKPGLWADADPAKHIAWYKLMGVNVIQTFCLSCNGYAWYKDGVVPEQPGLKYDFLTEMVRLGHKEGMLVLGYFCAGSNTKWGQNHPELSYGTPSEPHIPYTDAYLSYLDRAIRDAVQKTGIDGFMIDWLRMPTARGNAGWLKCEQQLYAQLMGEAFPGEQGLAGAKATEFGRRAVERCWKTIRRAAKESNPNCIVWLTCCDVNDPHIVNSSALRECDWLLNEAGDKGRTEDAKRMIGPQTRLITCLANWNGQEPTQIVPAAQNDGIGLYGFTKPGPDSLLPLEPLLAKPLNELKGDEKNIGALARAFHGASMSSTWTSDERFVERYK